MTLGQPTATALHSNDKINATGVFHFRDGIKSVRQRTADAYPIVGLNYAMLLVRAVLKPYDSPGPNLATGSAARSRDKPSWVPARRA